MTYVPPSYSLSIFVYCFLLFDSLSSGSALSCAFNFCLLFLLSLRIRDYSPSNRFQFLSIVSMSIRIVKFR